jgi:signal transduction histidine kinase
MILFVSLALFLGAVYVYALALKKQRRLKAIAEIRNHIARDLHDDIGATLTSISFYTQAAQQKLALKKYDEVSNLINQTGLNAREAIANMNDTVWVINPKNDSVKALCERIEDYGRRLLAETKTAFYFYYKDDELLNALNIEQRKHMYLICKEALNNCAKYAQAKNVELLIERQAIIIRDDGVGFDAKQENDGNGLLNMKSRAHQLGAQYEMIAEPNKGTCIKLTFLHPSTN